ncbi:Prefoldin beta-like [Trinorchestia longiramus]|nr:Prefoldin beta-like [Trinorchestia longiramus]
MAGLDSISGEEDVHLTYEDQQKINKFARCNTRLEEVKEELKTKETDLHNLGDAEDEMMIALDADEKVPYLLGEVFLLKTQESATESIGKEKELVREEIDQLKSKASDLEASMSQLKADLYAKFGNNINLEADED